MRVLPWVALAALLACAADPKPSAGGAPPVLRFVGEEGATARVDFGAVAIGAAARRTLVVENRSAADARLRLPDLEAPFALEGEVEETLPPGARRALALRFLPEEEGRFERELPLGGGLRLRLRGEGRAAPQGCAVEIEPRELRFVTSTWEETRPATLEVRSVGTGACLLEGAALSRSADPFYVDAPPPTLLAPGAATSISLRFDPAAAGSREAELLVRVDGGEELVTLRVASEPACARVEEAALRFDGAAPGCHLAAPLTLVNDCPHPLDLLLTALEGVDEAFEVDPGPLRLAPFGSGRLWLGYRPAPIGAGQRGLLHLAFGNGDALSVPVEGGVAAGREERFVATGTPLDLLVVVDLSTEMQPFQDGLAALAATIDGWMEQPQLDLRVAVTTNSMEEERGCGGERGALRPVQGPGPRFVEVDTADRGADLAAKLLVGVCMHPSGSQPLEAAMHALLEPDPAGWRRAEVPLFILFVGVGEDRSPRDFFDYVDFLEEQTGVPGESGFASAIVPLAGCADMEPATLVADAVGLLEGAIVPICRLEWWPEAFAKLELVRESAALPRWPVRSALEDLDGDGAWSEADGLSLWLDGARLPASQDGAERWRVVSTPEGPRLELLSFDLLPRSRAELLLRSPHLCD